MPPDDAPARSSASTVMCEAANAHALRERWHRTRLLERAVLAAVRRGRKLTLDDTADAAVRTITNAVLDLPEADRGLAVCYVLIDFDDVHARWRVLAELDGGHRTRALALPYPT
ncbi:hypothetical protein NOV72_03287 [Caballeronia novacaledonica]|uniref:Uncharacterized protein n=1 Tax=Caballeronia novacaledonica TaxID=1544861 RepID=A0A2U3I7F6_9BURK|nr:hypothetical protein [Caballeronia novacaledonica]SPB16087.1 hypothetical protein NOV72_03287 [Caballeronia novacaledonica]